MSLRCRASDLTPLLLVAIAHLLTFPAVLPAEPAIDFRAEVWPILHNRCLICHGPDKQRADLRLDSPAALLKGGESGPAVVVGDPAQSLLIERVTAKDEAERMPPKGDPLTTEQVATLTRWIAVGAAWPTDFDAAKEMAHKPLSWAWQPVKRPTVPQSSYDNPIDAFLAQRLAARGLQMSPATDPRTFIRRVTFDLIGLPPTPEEVASFVEECAAPFAANHQLPDAAVERLAQRLLASPHYGERWARHWLDVVRFTESDGFEEDERRVHAWTYRDYLVQAFNEDKPYAQFVREQIAGDVLQPVSPQGIAATGFLVAGSWDALQRVTPSRLGRLQSREDQLEEIVGAVGQTFLGLTVNCARCHDHKFDPIPQADYYRVKAIFEGIDHGLTPKTRGTRRMFSAADDAAWLEKSKRLREQIAKQETGLKDLDTQLRATKKDAARTAELQAQKSPLEQALATTKQALQCQLPMTLAFTGDRQQPPPTMIYARGDITQPDETVTPGGLSALALPASDWGLQPDSPEAERRLRFAEWLTHPEHPLTARVLVNRFWQYHFGIGIVDTPSDFGANGNLPSHPELLDWLASEFLRRGGSSKQLHRLIVTSAAYRQLSVAVPASPSVTALHSRAAAIDADDRLLWKFPARRIEGEAVRDAMLAMSGELNRELGGPSFEPFTVTQLNTYFYHLFDKDEPAFNRRSLYRMHVLTGRSPLLDALDCPSPAITTPKRQPTVTALQALALMNDVFVVRQADRLAQRIAKETSEPAEQVTLAFAIVLARHRLPPSWPPAWPWRRNMGCQPSRGRSSVRASFFI